MSITRRTIGQLDSATCVLSSTEVIIANGCNTEKTTMAGIRGFVTETLSTFANIPIEFQNKVGIGTGAPNEMLTVVGNVSATGTIFAPTLETDIEATDLVVTNGLSADGNTFTVNASTNKVGIGTSSPNEMLTVVGNVSATGTIFAPTLETDIEATDLVVTNGLSASGNTFTVNASTNKVGIGTSSPGRSLHVKTSTNDEDGQHPLRVEGSSTGTAGERSAIIEIKAGDDASFTGIDFGDSTAAHPGSIVYNHSNNSMIFDTNDATRMTIDSSGDITIPGNLVTQGSTTFSDLSVAGSTTFSDLSVAGEISAAGGMDVDGNIKISATSSKQSKILGMYVPELAETGTNKGDHLSLHGPYLNNVLPGDPSYDSSCTGANIEIFGNLPSSACRQQSSNKIFYDATSHTFRDHDANPNDLLVLQTKNTATGTASAKFISMGSKSLTAPTRVGVGISHSDMEGLANELTVCGNISASGGLSANAISMVGSGSLTTDTLVVNEIQSKYNRAGGGDAQPITYDAYEHRFRDYDETPNNLMVICKTAGVPIGKVGINQSNPKVALHVVGGHTSAGALTGEALRVVGSGLFTSTDEASLVIAGDTNNDSGFAGPLFKLKRDAVNGVGSSIVEQTEIGFVGDNGGGFFQDSLPNATYIQVASGRGLQFATGVTSKNTMTLAPDNKVGIGTNEPVRVLHIKDTVNPAGIKIEGGTSSFSEVIFSDTSDEGSISYDHQTDKLNFNNTSTRMTIDSDGKVGIGTTNPNSNLTLSASKPILELQNSVDNYSRILFSDTNRANPGCIEFDTEYHCMSFSTLGNTVMTLASTGNVGIGTTLPAPSEALHVVGNTTITGNLSVHGDFTRLDTSVTTTSALSVTNLGTGPALFVCQAGSQPIAHFIDSNGDDVIFDDNGKVGLGTTPVEKLTVSGNLSSSGCILAMGGISQFAKTRIFPDKGRALWIKSTDPSNPAATAYVQGPVTVGHDLFKRSGFTDGFADGSNHFHDLTDINLIEQQPEGPIKNTERVQERYYANPGNPLPNKNSVFWAWHRVARTIDNAVVDTSTAVLNVSALTRSTNRHPTNQTLFSLNTSPAGKSENLIISNMPGHSFNVGDQVRMDFGQSFTGPIVAAALFGEVTEDSTDRFSVALFGGNYKTTNEVLSTIDQTALTFDEVTLETIGTSTIINQGDESNLQLYSKSNFSVPREKDEVLKATWTSNHNLFVNDPLTVITDGRGDLVVEESAFVLDNDPDGDGKSILLVYGRRVKQYDLSSFTAFGSSNWTIHRGSLDGIHKDTLGDNLINFNANDKGIYNSYQIGPGTQTDSGSAIAIGLNVYNKDDNTIKIGYNNTMLDIRSDSVAVSGNLTVAGTVDSADNITITKSTGVAELKVSGPISQLKLNDTDASSEHVIQNVSGDLYYNAAGSGTDYGNHVFSTSRSSDDNTKPAIMTIDGVNANVGIGCTTPNASNILDVQGDSNFCGNVKATGFTSTDDISAMDIIKSNRLNVGGGNLFVDDGSSTGNAFVKIGAYGSGNFFGKEGSVNGAAFSLGVGTAGKIVEDMRVDTFALSGAGLVNKNTNPVILVASPGANKYIVPVSIQVYKSQSGGTRVSWNSSDIAAIGLGTFASSDTTGTFSQLTSLPRVVAEIDGDWLYNRNQGPDTTTRIHSNRALAFRTSSDISSNTSNDVYYLKVRYMVMSEDGDFKSIGNLQIKDD